MSTHASRARRLVLLFAAAFLPRLPAWADGCMLVGGDSPAASWEYFDESAQEAVIEHEGGVETLYVRVGLPKPERRAVAWVMPIPADPAKTEVDVVTEFPHVQGDDVTKEARDFARGLLAAAVATQFHLELWRGFWALASRPFFGVLEFSMGSLSDDGAGSPGGSRATKEAEPPDVVVHKHLEKEGLVTELLTARTADGLYRYLDVKGLGQGKRTVPVLERYVGREFSFVATWMDGSKGGGMQRGIKLTFPAARPFFPLYPSSVYGDRVLPVTVTVRGFMRPLLPEGLRSLAKTDYLLPRRPEGWERATRLHIEAPARLLTDDLFFEAGAPLRTRYHALLLAHGRAAAAAFFLFAALAAGAAAGWFAFPDRRTPAGLARSAAVGLGNALTVVGVYAVLLWLDRPPPDEAPTPRHSGAAARVRAWFGRYPVPLPNGRSLVYLPLFSLFFLALAHAAAPLFWVVPYVFEERWSHVAGEGIPLQGALTAALALWSLSCAFMFLCGAPDGRPLGRRFLQAVAALGFPAFLVLVAMRAVAGTEVLRPFGNALPLLVDFPWYALPFLAPQVWALGSGMGLAALLAPLALRTLDPSRPDYRRRSAALGALWGAFVSAPFPLARAGWDAVWTPLVGALLALAFAQWRLRLADRPDPGPRKAASVAAGGCAVLTLAYGVNLYARLPNASWSSDRLVQTLALTRSETVGGLAGAVLQRRDVASAPQAVPALLRLMREGPEEAGDDAARVFRRNAGFARAAEAELIALLPSATSDSRRYDLFDVLGRSETGASLDALAAASSAADRQTRVYALRALGGLSWRRLEAIAKINEARLPYETKRPLVTAEQEAGLAERAAMLKSRGAVAALTRAAVADPEWSPRYEAHLQLKRLSLPERFPSALEGLKDPADEVRSHSLEVLRSSPPYRAAAVLLLTRHLADSEDPGILESAAEGLRSLGAVEGVGTLVRLLEDPGYGHRPQAAAALGRLCGAPAAVEALVRAAADTHAAVRRAAAESLGRCRPEGAVTALLRAAEDADRQTRRAALEALARLKPLDEAQVARIGGVFTREKDWANRRAAARLLERSPSRKTLPALAAALTSDDRYLQGKALSALRRLGPPCGPALGALQGAAAKAEAAWVRVEAAELAVRCGP